LTVVAMRVSNEYRSSFAIHSCNTAPTPPGFSEIVGDYFPALHGDGFCLFCSLRGNGKVIKTHEHAGESKET
jgi:hypothetical protein